MRLVILAEVEEFIVMLEKPTQSKWARQVGLIATYGMTVGMPHVKRLNSTLSELRVRGKQEIRGFTEI